MSDVPPEAQVWDLLRGALGTRALAIVADRDEEQWRALLESSGFEPVSIEDGLIEARCR